MKCRVTSSSEIFKARGACTILYSKVGRRCPMYFLQASPEFHAYRGYCHEHSSKISPHRIDMTFCPIPHTRQEHDQHASRNCQINLLICTLHRFPRGKRHCCVKWITINNMARHHLLSFVSEDI